MVFSSLTFVCLFLPIVLALYFSAPQSARNIILVAASAVFYVWGGRIAIVLIAISIAVNFALGQAIATAAPHRRHQLISWSVAGNLLVLIIFKYADFIVDNINVVLDAYWNYKLPNPNIPLPLGISFFTFHIISYLVDVYRGVAQAQRSPAAFALYILNFPQLIAGPIIRYAPIAGQLDRRTVTFDDIDNGIARFAAGLANLFRFLGLFGHGDRNGAHVRLSFSRKFQLSVRRDVDSGFLAPLEYHALGLVPRLCLYPPGRQPRLDLDHDAKSMDRVPAVRRMAWRELELHRLGDVARPVPID
jgi:hypothetical protein